MLCVMPDQLTSDISINSRATTIKSLIVLEACTPNATYSAFMRDYSIKPMIRLEKWAGSSESPDVICPQNRAISETFDDESTIKNGL